MSTSPSMLRSTPGYWSFSARSRPSRAVAACTWPIDAAASGSKSNSAKRLFQSRPNSCASTCRTCASGMKCAWFWSCASASRKRGGSMPSPCSESSWPSFIAAPRRSASVSVRRSAFALGHEQRAVALAARRPRAAAPRAPTRRRSRPAAPRAARSARARPSGTRAVFCAGRLGRSLMCAESIRSPRSTAPLRRDTRSRGPRRRARRAPRRARVRARRSSRPLSAACADGRSPRARPRAASAMPASASTAKCCLVVHTLAAMHSVQAAASQQKGLRTYAADSTARQASARCSDGNRFTGGSRKCSSRSSQPAKPWLSKAAASGRKPSEVTGRATKHASAIAIVIV